MDETDGFVYDPECRKEIREVFKRLREEIGSYSVFLGFDSLFVTGVDLEAQSPEQAYESIVELFAIPLLSEISESEEDVPEIPFEIGIKTDCEYYSGEALLKCAVNPNNPCSECNYLNG